MTTIFWYNYIGEIAIILDDSWADVIICRGIWEWEAEGAGNACSFNYNVIQGVS